MMNGHPNAGVQGAEDQLARLEAALLSLRPKIEAALLNQGQTNQAATYTPATAVAKAPEPVAVAVPATTPASSSPLMKDSPESPLRQRRGVAALSLVTVTEDHHPASTGITKQPVENSASTDQARPAAVSDRPKLEPKAAVAPVVVRPAVATTAPATASPTAGNDAKKFKERKPVQIDAVRVAANAMDPESPRSPGKFSAWK